MFNLPRRIAIYLLRYRNNNWVLTGLTPPIFRTDGRAARNG